jgi:hypothetical protein
MMAIKHVIDIQRCYSFLFERGWIGIRLDLEDVDWETVTERARRAFQSTAPRKLAALIEVASQIS